MLQWSENMHELNRQGEYCTQYSTVGLGGETIYWLRTLNVNYCNINLYSIMHMQNTHGYNYSYNCYALLLIILVLDH